MVIYDFINIFPNAILIGASAIPFFVKKDVQSTEDIDFVLSFYHVENLNIYLSPAEEKMLKQKFGKSDDSNHSLKHKETGLYVDILVPRDETIFNEQLYSAIQCSKKFFVLRQIKSPKPIKFKVAKPEAIIGMKLRRILNDSDSVKGLRYKAHILTILNYYRTKKKKLNFDLILSFLNDKETNLLNFLIETSKKTTVSSFKKDSSTIAVLF